MEGDHIKPWHEGGKTNAATTSRLPLPGIWTLRSVRAAVVPPEMLPPSYELQELNHLYGSSDCRYVVGHISYQTLEVELEDGRVRPAGAEELPAKATALLTILSAAPADEAKPARSLAEALRGLKVEGRGEFTDLSTNKRHMDDFGK